MLYVCTSVRPPVSMGKIMSLAVTIIIVFSTRTPMTHLKKYVLRIQTIIIQRPFAFLSLHKIDRERCQPRVRESPQAFSALCFAQQAIRKTLQSRFGFSASLSILRRCRQDFSKWGLHCVKVRVPVCLDIFKLRCHGIFATCSRLFG